MIKRLILWAWPVVALLVASCAALPDEPRSQGPAKEWVVAVIPVGRYPHGLAVDEEQDRVYVANLDEGTISVIDGVTNRVVKTIRSGEGTRDVAIRAETGRLYAANLGLYDRQPARVGLLRVQRAGFAVAVLDGQSGETLAHVRVGTKPWALAVDRATGRVYVANYYEHSVSVIDGERDEAIATIDLGRQRLPYDLAVNARTNRVYVTDARHVWTIGMGRGRLLVVDGDTHRVLNAVRVGRSAHVAVNERTNRVYATSPGEDELLVIDGQEGDVVATIEVGSEPLGLAVDEAANRVYVANRGSKSLSVVDGRTERVLYDLGLGTSPGFVAVNQRTGRIYVTHPDDDAVTVLAANSY